jgi:hypothetical protein
MEYLGIADLDYLAARLLLLNGLVFSALPKAAEAFEKLMKLFLMIEAKVNRNEEVYADNLKRYSHNLTRLFAEIKTKVPTTFSNDWDEYFELLRVSYSRRYPEEWKEYQMEGNIHKLDFYYTYLRNNIIANFPLEEIDRAKQFGTFIYDGFSSPVRELISVLGGKPPGDILRQNNQSFELLEIHRDRL